MAKQTWFKLYRGWQDSPMFRNDSDKLNWLWMLEKAVYEDEYKISINNSPYTLKRGQLSYSIRYLAKAWKTTPSYVRTFLKHLEKWHAIQTQNRTGQTIITICNYSKYQDCRTENDTAGHQNIASLSHRHRTNTKKDKKEKKDKKNIYMDENRFDEFWEKFPRQRRGNKQNAYSAYKAALKRASENEIHEGLNSYVVSREVKEGYAKGAAAWLRDDRWTHNYSEGERNDRKPSVNDVLERNYREIEERYGSDDSGDGEPVLRGIECIRQDN